MIDVIDMRDQSQMLPSSLEGAADLETLTDMRKQRVVKSCERIQSCEEL